IRGRHVDDARRVLRFTQRGASGTVSKVLESAVANAEHNHALPGDELVVARAWVDEGPTLRRFRPRALGRATRIRKRTCHISIVVGREEPEALETPTARRAVRRRKDATAEPESAETTTAPPKKRTTRKKTTAKKTTAKKSNAKKTTAKRTTTRKSPAKKTTRKKEGS
ncbi:MAG: 50S ribosomal protein L22, partial [Actinomycetota bacterium]